MPPGFLRICGFHEGGSNQKSLTDIFQPKDILGRFDTAFGDHGEARVPEATRQLCCFLRIDRHVIEIPVVDTCQQCPGFYGIFRIFPVPDLDKRLDIQGPAEKDELFKPVLQNIGYQKHGVGLQGIGFVDLLFIDDEILSKDRKPGSGFCFGEIFRTPRKVARFRQNGNGTCPACFIQAGEVSRIQL